MQQAAMNNAEKQGEKWAGKAHDVIDRGVSEIKNFADTENLKSMASDLSGRVKGASGDAYRESLAFVRRNPVSTALGLAAVGFFAGVWASRSRK